MGQLIPVINLRSNGFASLPPANHQLTVSFSSTPIQRTFLHWGVPRSRIGHFLLSPVTRRSGCVEHLPPNFTRVTHLSSLYHLLKPPLLPFLQIRLWPTFPPTVGSMCHRCIGGAGLPIFGWVPPIISQLHLKGAHTLQSPYGQVGQPCC